MDRCFMCSEPATASCPDCDELICDECMKQGHVECLDYTSRLASSIIVELEKYKGSNLSKLVRELFLDMWNREEINFDNKARKILGLINQ